VLPRSLPEALKAMKGDCDYLCHGDVFPHGLLDFWDRYKYAEAEAIMLRPHPWEYNLYYGS
jgi:glutamine synthetase